MTVFYLIPFLFTFTCAVHGQKVTTMKEIEFSYSPGSWTTDYSSCISGNRLTLRNSVLYQDEEGRTHYTNIERIGQGICVKKQFFIKNPSCTKAELFVFRGAGLKLACNDNDVGESAELPSTGWRVWNIPTTLLRKGINEFIFTGNGMLIIEPSLYPDRSARSFDGGRTWNFNVLGINNGNGEYLVRLRLQQYPETGTAPVIFAIRWLLLMVKPFMGNSWLLEVSEFFAGEIFLQEPML